MATHLLWRVFEELHGIFDDNFIFKADEFDKLFGNPWSNNSPMNLFLVNLQRALGPAPQPERN